MKKLILLTLIIITAASTALAQKKHGRVPCPRGANLITITTPFTTAEAARAWIKYELAELHIYFDTYDPEIYFLQTKPFSGWKKATLRLDIFFKKQADSTFSVEITTFYILGKVFDIYAIPSEVRNYSLLENVGLPGDWRRNTFRRLIRDVILRMNLNGCTVTANIKTNIKK